MSSVIADIFLSSILSSSQAASNMFGRTYTCETRRGLNPVIARLLRLHQS